MSDTSAPDTTNWREVFESTYSSSASPTQERVWRQVFGDEYPEGVDPYSLVSRTELGRFTAEVRVGPGNVLADIGCGRGGAGLWVAAATGADLIGIDIAENALTAARQRAAAMGRASATFRQGEFESTGLPDASVDAIMSVDALLFTPSKARAFVELRRVLRQGGRLVLTSWDYRSQPAGRPPQVADHRPIAEDAGFEVIAYDDTEGWRDRMAGTAEGLLDAVVELAAETGSPVDEVRASIAEMHATFETMIRRFFFVAEAR